MCSLAGCGAPAGLATVERFMRAFEAGDLDTVRGLFVEDARLFGPVIPEPVRGRGHVGAVLWAARSRFDRVRYVGQLTGRAVARDGEAEVEMLMLPFRAELNGRQIDAIDVIEMDADEMISTLTVFFRPLDWVAGTGFVARPRQTPR
jgi:SnoaL-like domain